MTGTYYPTAMSYATPYKSTSTKALDFVKRTVTFKENWRRQAKSSLGMEHDLQFAGFWFSYTEIVDDGCDNLIYS